MPNPFDELGDLDDAFAAIDEHVERRIHSNSPDTLEGRTDEAMALLREIARYWYGRTEPDQRVGPDHVPGGRPRTAGARHVAGRA